MKQNIKTKIRNNWTKAEVISLMTKPFADLIYEAQNVHRDNFDS